MTRLMLACLALCIGLSLAAQESTTSGLQFLKGTWADALQMARVQNKMIFVDMYTDWCGPCKLMDKTVFPTKEAGDKYNQHFVNVKLNAEKGEGIAVAKQFNVNAYPTYLYLNSQGVLVHRYVGAAEIAVFNQVADKALQLGTDTVSIGTMEAAFKQGKRDPVFMRSYIQQLKELGQNDTQILDEYFNAQSHAELQAEDNLVFMGGNLNSVNTPVIVYVMDRYPKSSAAAKKQVTDNLYAVLVERGLNDPFKQKRFTEVRQIIAYADLLEGLTDRKRWYIDRLRLAYAGMIRDAQLIKSTGYRLMRSVEHIPIDSMRREDLRRYKTFLEPYVKGEKDSTNMPGWQEEQPFLKAQYSNEVSSKLFIGATAFAALPDSEEKALKDALVWARKVKEVGGENKLYVELVEKLEKRVNK